jgi:hypothetical protein
VAWSSGFLAPAYISAGCRDISVAPGVVLLVLLVNDSEYSKSAGAKPIFKSLLAVFISFPWRAARPYPVAKKTHKATGFFVIW